MDVISIHSHKGGAGKTTISLMLAKQHALAGKKVCAVDLDFIGSGFDCLLPINDANKNSLGYYLVTPEDKIDEINLEDIIIKFSNEKEISDQNKSFDIILNHGSQIENELSGHRDRLLGLIGREGRQKIIGRAVEKLLRKLEEIKYDTVILDCHPGLTYLSRTIMRIANDKYFKDKFINIFVTTTNRSHFVGTLQCINYLKSNILKNDWFPVLFINKTDTETNSWNQIQSAVRSELIFTQKADILSTYSNIPKNKNHIYLKRLDSSLLGDKIGTNFLIRLPKKDEIEYNTQYCRKVLLDLGRIR